MSYDVPTKKFAISADVDALATLLAQRQSDSGTTNGGIVASGGSPAVPQLGTDAAGLGIAYLKAQADAILCGAGWQGLQDVYQFSGYADASGAKTSFQNIGASWTVTVPLSKTYQLRVDFGCWNNSSSTSGRVNTRVLVDGVTALSQPWNAGIWMSTYLQHMRIHYVVPVTLSAGTHTLQLQWMQDNTAFLAATDSNAGRTFTLTA